MLPGISGPPPGVQKFPGYPTTRKRNAFYREENINDCCGPLGALKDPLGAQEGSPGPLGGAQCPAGGRSILDRSLIDPKVAESVFAGDVEQNVVG